MLRCFIRTNSLIDYKSRQETSGSNLISRRIKPKKFRFAFPLIRVDAISFRGSLNLDAMPPTLRNVTSEPSRVEEGGRHSRLPDFRPRLSEQFPGKDVLMASHLVSMLDFIPWNCSVLFLLSFLYGSTTIK